MEKQELVNSLNTLTKLKGSSNYREWRFRVNLAVRQSVLGQNKKKIPEELELRNMNMIVNSISDTILGNVMHCKSTEEMLNKLDELYGICDADKDQLQLEFQTYRFDNSLSMQENVSRLEGIRQKLIDLGEIVTDSAFKTRLIDCVPARFDHITSASNLFSSITLADVIKGLTREEKRLQRQHDEKKEQPDSRRNHVAMVSVVCYSCGGAGHKSFQCKQKSTQQNKPSLKKYQSTWSGNSANKDSEEIACKYCTEKGHIVKECPTLQKRNNAVCYKCGKKGHFAKNCGSKLEEKRIPTVACMGLSSFADPKVNGIDKKLWVLDSACNEHVCNNRSYFQSWESVDANILVGDDKRLKVDSKGKVKGRHGSCNLLFNDVLLNENSPVNLISVVKLLNTGWSVRELSLEKFVLEKNSFTITASLFKCNLWVVPIDIVISSSEFTRDLSVNCNLSVVDWHERFAHQNFDYTKDILTRLGIERKNLPKDFKCESCLKGKIARSAFESSDSREKHVGDLTHADLMISPTVSLGGSKYALCLKDDYSNYRTVYFLRSKRETTECFQDYFTRLKTQTGKNPKCLRTDNGTEELNSEINAVISELGLIHQLTCPFTPEQNGRIERDMRTLSEAVGTILIDSGLEKNMWAEGLAYVVYTLNRVSKSSVPGKTPFELFYDKGPFNVKLLQRFGTKVVFQIPKEKRKKFDPKGETGVFVGHKMFTKGYKVYSNGKIDVSRNVVFLNRKNLDGKNDQAGAYNEPESTDEAEHGNESDTELETVEIDFDWDEPAQASISLVNITVPNCVADLDKMDESDRMLWKNAMQRELQCMEKYNVWEPITSDVDLGKVNLIDTMWVFRVKSTANGEMAKARLVAKGFQADSARSSNYAPVASIVSLRVFLATVVHFELVLKQLDVETAFLNGTLKEPVFIKGPVGCSRVGVGLRLRKALYGLPESPKCWYDELKEVLLDLGFRTCTVETCLFTLRKGAKFVIIIVYVDDMLIAGNNDVYIEEIIAKLNVHFSLKVTSDINSFVGLTLKKIDRELIIDQETYLEMCTQDAKFAKPVKIPMEEKLDLVNLNSNNKTVCIKKFQRLLGTLNYVMERTRPDVSFSINLLSRYTNQADEELLKYLTRVKRYLWSTKNLKLRYVPDCDVVLEAYCDASWAPKADSERKSTTGYVIRVFGNLVQYKTRKQSSVALSSTESEYIALSECCRDVLVMRNLLKEMGVEINGPCKVFCDNQPSIKIANGEGKSNRTKHVEIKFYFVRDLINKNLVELLYVSSDKNLADFLTKAVGESKLVFSLDNLSFFCS